MKVSLISPLFNESSRLRSHLQDLTSFMKRFPLDWELLWVIPADDRATLQAAQEITDSHVRVFSVRGSSRAEAVETGLKKADGDILIILSWDFSVPLAEVFSFIQEFMQAEKVQMLIGNRYDPKKRNELRRSQWHQTLENMIREKIRREGISAHDPLSPFLGLRRFDKSHLSKLSLRGWYYTPTLLRWALQLGWQVEEKAITAKTDSESKAPIFREFLRNVF